MQSLKERIRKEGKVLPGNIVKVDGFLNHRVDCHFSPSSRTNSASILTCPTLTSS